MDDLTLLLDLDGSRILLNDNSIKIGEQLGQFNQVTLNLLDLLVACPHHLGNLLCIASPVALNELQGVSIRKLLENWRRRLQLG